MTKLKIVGHIEGEPVQVPDGYRLVYENGEPYLIKK